LVELLGGSKGGKLVLTMGGGLLVPPFGGGGGVFVLSTGGAFVPGAGELPEPEPGRGVTANTVAAQTVTPSRMAVVDLVLRFIGFFLVQVVPTRPGAGEGRC
jgi:hypothetical protein